MTDRGKQLEFRLFTVLNSLFGISCCSMLQSHHLKVAITANANAPTGTSSSYLLSWELSSEWLLELYIPTAHAWHSPLPSWSLFDDPVATSIDHSNCLYLGLQFSSPTHQFYIPSSSLHACILQVPLGPIHRSLCCPGTCHQALQHHLWGILKPVSTKHQKTVLTEIPVTDTNFPTRDQYSNTLSGRNSP